MSIISEALKKANAERGRASSPAGMSRLGAGSRSWLASVAILILLVAPFALPRFVGQKAPGGAPSAAQDTTAVSSGSLLPIADAPEARSSGLAQMAVESARMSGSAWSANAASVNSAAGTMKLQGIVRTDAEGYYAILNNDVVRVGSQVGMMRVSRITASGVELTDGTRSEFVEKSF